MTTMMKLGLGLALACAACSSDEPPPDDEKNTDLGEDPAGDASDLGEQCVANGDCDADSCLFKVQEDGSLADYGYCSGTCESFSDCPSFWDCGEVGNASGKYCIQN
jgi:hypothetical protein